MASSSGANVNDLENILSERRLELMASSSRSNVNDLENILSEQHQELMASSSGSNVNDVENILSEQRQELMSALEEESDLNFAFKLQMQEAINASLALQPSKSSSSPSSSSPPLNQDDEGLSFVALAAEEFERLEQELKDREMTEAEMRKMRDDLNRRIHDQKVASDILSIREEDWQNDGDNFERPYGGEGSQSAAVLDESFRVYVTGLVSEEGVMPSNATVAAIGVAICDPIDLPLFELRKPLFDEENKSMVNFVDVGIEALIEGLNAAIALDLNRITCFCDDYLVHQYVTGRLPPPPTGKTTKLIAEVKLLRAKFANFTLSLVARTDIKFAVKLARDAIVSQLTTPSGMDHVMNMMETCVICFEDTAVYKMFKVDGCLHRFCLPCMKQHVEVKLLNGMMATCPHIGCKSKVNIDKCEAFLEPKLIEQIRQRMKEASIPVTEKVYCPNPRCSVLMSKSELLDYANKFIFGAAESGARRCTKCDGFFCVNCKVPWHYSTTCDGYKGSNLYQSAEDAKLKSLASNKLWQQCVKCNHMVELGEGCYHIYCRCGHEFCYTCGAEWKNKKATCKCVLWDERNIVYDNQQ